MFNVIVDEVEQVTLKDMSCQLHISYWDNEAERNGQKKAGHWWSAGLWMN